MMNGVSFLVTAFPSPEYALRVGVGGVMSGTIYNKLTHMAEYILLKGYGNYSEPRKTLDNRIIITVPNQKIFTLQSFALSLLMVGSLIAIASSEAISFPTFIFCIADITSYIPTDSKAQRWMALNDKEIKKYEMDQANIKVIEQGVYVYFNFGCRPQFFPGTRGQTTDPHEYRLAFDLDL